MDRAVTRTDKDTNGDITALCNPSAAWSPVSKSTAISQIEAKTHTYHVPWKTGRTEIRVVGTGASRYLRTDRDSTAQNNLDELPNC